MFFEHFQHKKIPVSMILLSIKSIFLYKQHAKSSIKTTLSKIFEQNVDYAKVDHLFTPNFQNDDVSRKIIKLLKTFFSQMVDKYKGYTHTKFCCKTKSRSKVTE